MLRMPKNKNILRQIRATERHLEALERINAAIEETLTANADFLERYILNTRPGIVPPPRSFPSRNTKKAYAAFCDALSQRISIWNEMWNTANKISPEFLPAAFSQPSLDFSGMSAPIHLLSLTIPRTAPHAVQRTARHRAHSLDVMNTMQAA